MVHGRARVAGPHHTPGSAAVVTPVWRRGDDLDTRPGSRPTACGAKREPPPASGRCAEPVTPPSCGGHTAPRPSRRCGDHPQSVSLHTARQGARAKVAAAGRERAIGRYRVSAAWPSGASPGDLQCGAAFHTARSQAGDGQGTTGGWLRDAITSTGASCGDLQPFCTTTPARWPDLAPDTSGTRECSWCRGLVSPTEMT